ncbi:UDP-N-acetylglucosamine--undecaprenyl-phosphate N-acetylglucosaminephosphotransferase [Thalassomonas actiniarum]|uniref:Undecaprenyl-phosphate alpha-N-acetylglucosaminyl 1-phosphate transferase n=1 Tax=Thalassomonas actiniarum TaxID=485447 RepID=A0AAE9YUE7_9GAMM|nr:UDP-N-acetylglucosamine--undecaprenyl-phosphate N-acetylglucosaminephosphotransferase [Thalassomonas actiniarum]WDE00515.1 UDP-N-acetylglucosamine--undecaprenyl-phosphate N-acetylglucosaminephosphotransferase [Thalassomonas actiniarum]
MLFLLPALFVAFFASISTIKVLLPLAPHIGLVDLPTERKNHDGAIPLIGGISIFTGVLIASSLFIEQSQLLNLYLISSAFLVFLGTLDDIYDLSVMSRIIFQGIIASILVFGAGIYISDFGEIFASGPVDIGIYGMIFTCVACIAAINAFNMVDGIDGLAGSMSIITIASVALMKLLSGQLDLILLPLVLVVAIVPFLFYNVSRRNPRGKKIFMGDAGSMFMGLTVIWLLTLETQGENASFRPVTALWVIGIPLMDMLSIMLRRIRTGSSPFKADNNHIHHIVIRAGYSSRQALIMLSLLAILFAAIGVFGEVFQVPEWFMLTGFIVLFVFYTLILSRHSKGELALSKLS